MKTFPRVNAVVINNRNVARHAVTVLFAVLLSAIPFHAVFAQTAPNLGAADDFAVLAGQAVTCTDSAITGNVGSGLPGSTIAETNCTIMGNVFQDNATASEAYSDFLIAYDALALAPCNVNVSGTLANQVLAPGVYCFDAAATLTGQLTLDGPANGVWIFKVGTLGTGALTGTNFSVVMSGGGQSCNVYWWVAEAATMTTSNFQGSILAGMATTFTGGSLIGRDLAKADTTLTGVTVSGCGSGTTPPPDTDHDKDHCKDHGKHHDKNHDKDHNKDHNKDRDHDKDRDNGHDNDHGDRR